MADTCSVCGENSVEDDYENGRKIRVCMECGTLANDTDELTSEAQFEGTTITSGQSYGPKVGKAWMNVNSQVNKGKENAKKVILNVGSQLHFSEEMNDEALALLERVYDHELSGTSDGVKKAWCLACICISGRNHGYALKIRDLGSFLNIDNGVVKLGAALKCLKTRYNVHLPPVDISCETHSIFNNSELSGDVLRMAQQLVMLLQRILVTQGRSVLSCAVPCAYYAWKASDFIKYKKISLVAFCKKFKLQGKHNYRKEEIEKAFKKMAMEIPWVKASGQDVKYVEPHLKDIIKYQSMLISEAVQTGLRNVEDQCGNEGKTDDIDVAKVFRKPGRKRHAKYLDKENDEDNERKRKVSRMRCKSNDKKCDQDVDTVDDNSDLDSFDLGSDDDTDAYILSAKEVVQKQEMEKHLTGSAER